MAVPDRAVAVADRAVAVVAVAGGVAAVARGVADRVAVHGRGHVPGEAEGRR